MADGGGGAIPYIGAAILVGTESGVDASGTFGGSVATDVVVLGDALSVGGAVVETLGSGFGGPPYIVTTARRQSVSAAGPTAKSAKTAARDERPIAERSRVATTRAPQNGHAAPTRT